MHAVTGYRIPKGSAVFLYNIVTGEGKQTFARHDLYFHKDFRLDSPAEYMITFQCVCPYCPGMGCETICKRCEGSWIAPWQVTAHIDRVKEIYAKVES